MKNRVESIVIVDNNFGSTATIRFNDPRTDRIISTSKSGEGWKERFYRRVERTVNEVLHGKSE